MSWTLRNKAPVVLLHGFPGLPEDWDALSSQIGPERAILVPRMPWLRSGQPSLTGFADALSRVIADLGQSLREPAHIVAHDIGGVILYWLSQTGFRNAVLSASFVAAPHPHSYGRFLGTDQGRLRTAYIDDILSVQDIAKLGQTLLSRVTGDDSTISMRLGRAIDQSDIVSVQSLYQQIRDTHSPVPQEQPIPVPGPSAVVHCAEDRFTPAQVMSDSVPCFGPATRSLCLEGDSHYAHISHPEAVARFLKDFWNDAERA